MWELLISTFDAGRLRSLASIVARYGFGDLLSRTGVSHALTRTGPWHPLARVDALAELPPQVRVRRMLEEMGPCFVKLGQVLASRVDLFPPEWIAEFSRLQNAVPSVPFASIENEMREAMGVEPQVAFLSIDPDPLAAGSIAQVHRARLPDGREVVVKVRRPGIRTTVEADLRLLQFAAGKMESRFPELRRFHPVGIARQFRASLTRELDLAAECHHAERIARSFAGDPRLFIPMVHWAFTSERMNVQDFVDGLPVADLAALDAAGVDRRGVAQTGAQLVLRMLLEDGFFHADPHPGNVFVLRDGRIGLIDFGMVGHLSDTRRMEVVALLFGLVERDARRVMDVLLDWAGRSEVDVGELTGDIESFVDRYHGLPLGELDLARMLLEVTVLLRTHRLSLPADLALLIKVCLTLDGVGRSLDPGFDMARQARPFLRRAMLAQYNPFAVARRGTRAAEEAIGLLATLPGDLRRLARVVRSRGLRMHVRLDNAQELRRDLSHSANRLAGAIIVAALVIGSSITMTVGGKTTESLGMAAFVGASLAGIWLLWSIFRSGGGR